MKRYLKGSAQRHALHYKRGVPSQINEAFKRHKIDAAFISSIASKRCQCTDIGILARKEVHSVILLPGKTKSDTESATSNVLAKVLNLEGEVLIGDKALKHFLEHDDNAIDLAKCWYEQHNLPFVFARLCYHGSSHQYERLSKKFLASSHKIPYYILERSSQKTGIAKNDILDYLKLIEYKIDRHAQLSLKRFLRLAQKLPR